MKAARHFPANQGQRQEALRLSILGVVIALAVGCPRSADAHQLSVFAKAQDDAVMITANFANGSEVKSGILRIFGADDSLLLQQDIEGIWPVVFSVGPHRDGLRIEVDAGNGHNSYWILTPVDLSQGKTD